MGTLVLAFEDWWLSPPPHSRGTLPGPSGRKVGWSGARWRGRGRAVSPDCASVGKLRGQAKKVVRVGMCGEVQVDDLVCCCCRCVRKQDRGCHEVHSNTVVLDRHTPGRHLLREHLQLDLLRRHDSTHEPVSLDTAILSLSLSAAEQLSGVDLATGEGRS